MEREAIVAWCLVGAVEMGAWAVARGDAGAARRAAVRHMVNAAIRIEKADAPVRQALQQMLTSWMRAHAAQATHIGQETGRVLVHILIGMVIGAMAALYDTTQVHRFRPLAAALHQRIVNLHLAFRQIVFAQVRIAAINAIFTGIFLVVALPMAGVHLPFVKI